MTGKQRFFHKAFHPFFLAVIPAILCIHMAFIVYYGMQKSGFHEDEYYSYYSSSGYEDISPSGAISEKTGHDVQRQFLVTAEHRFDFGQVIHNQELDVHPPLYYMSLNFVMSVFPERFTKWFAIGLNAIYSLVSCCGILFFFYYLDRSRYRCVLSAAAGLAYALSPAMISNVMFARMYSMSAMLTILYADVFLVLMKNRDCSRRKFISISLCGSVICYLSFLTHYFCLITAFFLTLGYCLASLARRKGLVRMLCYGLAQAFGIGLAVLTFPACIGHIFKGYRGTGAMDGLFGGDLVGLLEYYTPIINRNFFGGLMYVALILLGAAVAVGIIRVCRRRKNGAEALSEENIICAVVLGSTVLAMLILCKTALPVGDVSSRFFYPTGALMIPFTAYCICKAGFCAFTEKTPDSRRKGAVSLRSLLCTAAVLIALLPAASGLVQGNVIFLYTEKKENVKFSQDNAESCAVVVFNGDPQYRCRSWFMANELWPFEHVVYVNYQDGNYILDSELLKTAESLIVYMDCPEDLLEDLVAINDRVSSYTLTRHDPFFYIYTVE